MLSATLGDRCLPRSLKRSRRTESAALGTIRSTIPLRLARHRFHCESSPQPSDPAQRPLVSRLVLPHEPRHSETWLIGALGGGASQIFPSTMKSDAVVPKSIDEYIAGFPPEVRAILQQVRATVAKAAPAAKEAIKYRLPTFVLNGNLIHFGAFQKHIGFYALPSGHAKFQRQLARYESGKGSVQFPLDKPIPYSLITQIVKFRVKENTQKVVPRKLR